MQQRKVLIGVMAVAVLGVGWYLFRPERLWVNQTVNERLGSAAGSRAAGARPAAMSGMQAEPESKVLASGMFHGVAHQTMGTATVYQVGENKRVLRFTGFETSNGPDVQVYMVAASDASDNATVTKSGFVRLAALKGNRGDQNYELPADLDLSKYRAVTIWCRRFGVNFATAPLAPQPF